MLQPINWLNLLKVPAGGFSAEYQAVYDSWTIKPDASVANNQNIMVASWVADGVWAKRDVQYVFAAHTNDNGEALTNWKNPGTNDATMVNNPAFVAFEGFTGANTKYIDTHYNPTDDGSNYKLDDAHASGYFRIDQQGNVYDFGVTDAVPNHLIMRIRNTSDQLNGFINSAGSMSPASTNSSGKIALQRTGATATEAFRNAGSIGTDNDVSSALPNADLYLLARNNNGVVADESDNQISEFDAGGSLTPTEITNDTNAFETYMDSNGKGVIA